MWSILYNSGPIFPYLFLLVIPCRLLLCQHHLSLRCHLYALPQRLLQLLNTLCLLPQWLLGWKKYSSQKHKTYDGIQNGSLIALMFRTKLFWIQPVKLMAVFSFPHLLWAINGAAAFASRLPVFPRRLLALLFHLPRRGWSRLSMRNRHGFHLDSVIKLCSSL